MARYHASVTHGEARNKRNAVIISKASESVFEIGQLAEALRAHRFTVEICHPDRFTMTMGSRGGVTYAGSNFSRPDVVLSRTGSGSGAHATTVLRQMEAMGVPVINSVDAIQAAMDKVRTMQLAANAGIPIPLTAIYAPQRIVNAPAWTGGFPCIVKVSTGSHGSGVFKCNDAGQLKALLDMIRTLDRKRPFLVQEYLGDRPGSDLRVLVLGGKAVGAMMRSATDGDFRANISAGGIGENFELTAEIVEISEAITRLLNLEIAGVDLLFSQDRFVLCEINSAPGFRGFKTYCGLDVADKMAEYVENQLKFRSINLAS